MHQRHDSLLPNLTSDREAFLSECERIIEQELRWLREAAAAAEQNRTLPPRP